MDKHPAIENLRTNQTQLDADGCMVGVSRQAIEETLTEIAGLRAELASSQERISELYRAQKNTILSAKSVEYDIDALCAAARQDAEEIARLKEDRTTELRNEFEGIRSELETTKRQSFVEGLNEAQRQYYPRVERLEATARQDAEEIARLREAGLTLLRWWNCISADLQQDIIRETGFEADEMVGVRAALACRPRRGQKS